MSIDLQAYAQQHDTPIISDATANFLISHLQQYQPTYVVEIGTAIGRSSMLIAEQVAQRGGHVYSFEISHPSYQIALLNQHQCNQYNLTIYRHDFLLAPVNRLLPNPIDFAFVDGTKSDYADYLQLLLPLCSKHATLICDDVGEYAHKTQSVRELLTTSGYTYQTIALADGDELLVIELTTP